MDALLSRQTWELVSSPELPVVSCRWIFTMKYRPDGTMDRYKARLVTRDFTHTYGVDYLKTFSPVARPSSICILFSLVASQQWPSIQVNVKNAFLYRDLNEVYMEQPPR